MKVKITHTARYEDVPNIVNELLNKCRAALRKSADFKFDILRLAKTSEEIREVQDTLDLVSSQLEDCFVLCQGYLEVHQQQTQSTELEVPVEEEESGEKNE